jgi:hypothetical protein
MSAAPDDAHAFRNLKHTSPHGTVMAVSMMKDEAPYLLEWFAHHLAVGFTDILVYTNDCTDGTVEMLQRLEALGLGFHRPNVIREGVKPQPSALAHAQAEPLVGAADWVMVFDADEFLSINHPSGHLDGMLDDAVALGANGIVVTWRIFGSNGVANWSRAPVTEQYTRAAPPLWRMGWGVKTLFKFDPEYWKLGIHRPTIKNKHLEDGFPDTVHWLNGSGAKMEDYFKFRGWRSIRRTVGFDWAQMNHYAVKSIDSYAIRKLRGNVNNKANKYNADYWSLQDRNEVPDTRILRHADRRAAIMAQLLTDPVLCALHEAALNRVEQRLADLRETEAYTAMRAELIEASKVPITEVEAKPPQARDPAKIAELMSRVEKRTIEAAAATPRREPAPVSGWNAKGVDPYRPGKVALSQDTPIDWVRSQEIELPADPQLFSPEAVMAVLAGKFDRRHARNIAFYVAGARRLLDLGAGVGLSPIKALREVRGLVVMLQDEGAGMVAAAAEIHRRNGLTDSAMLKLVSGKLRLAHDQGAGATGLAAYLRDFRPDVLRVNRRAGLAPEVLAAAPLDSVRKIVLPVDGDAELEACRAAFGPALTAIGFTEDAEAARNGSALFLRS